MGKIETRRERYVNSLIIPNIETDLSNGHKDGGIDGYTPEFIDIGGIRTRLL